jgi:hypothetical protein
MPTWLTGLFTNLLMKLIKWGTGELLRWISNKLKKKKRDSELRDLAEKEKNAVSREDIERITKDSCNRLRTNSRIM